MCGGDQGRLSKVLGGLVQRKDAPVLPSSQSDLELASSFSDFFSEKILQIRSELELDSDARDFSVDVEVPPLWQPFCLASSILTYIESKLLLRKQRRPFAP